MATYDFKAAFSQAIVAGAEGYSLINLFKVHLGIDPSDTTNDEAISHSIDMAGTFIEVYLDRTIAKQEVTEFFPHHFGSVVLHNPQIDTAADVTVTLNGVAQTDYSIWLDRGRAGHLSRTGCRQDVPMDWRTYDQVDVTYTAGYDPLPADVAQAIVWTAAELYSAQGSGSIPPGGGSGEIKSMSIYDVGSITYDVGSSGSSTGSYSATGVIPPTAADVLARYKRIAA